MLKLEKPSINSFIAGAKAETAPLAVKAAPQQPAPAKRGKPLSKVMAAPGEPVSCYQVRIPKSLHRLAKMAALDIEVPFGDFIVLAIQEKVERLKAEKAQG